MRKLFFTFILIFTTSYFVDAKNVKAQYFKYTGCRINAYDKKDFDPSEGVIVLDYEERQVAIYTGVYKVLFSACPITYEYLSGNDNHDFSAIDFSFIFLNLELIETKYQEY